MQTTILDIAKKAKVSHSTVSRIFNNKDKYSYAEATVEKVKQIARELGYKPHYLAKALKTGKTNMIGIVTVEDEKAPNPLTILFNDPYMAELYTGIGHTLAAGGYKMVFPCLRESLGMDNSLEMAAGKMVDGVVYVLLAEYMQQFMEECLPRLKSHNVPYVVTHTLRQKFEFPSVGFDCYTGGYQAARHLVDHGYGSIGFVTRNRPLPFHQDLLEGYKAALADQQRSYDEKQILYVEGTFLHDGYVLAQKLLDTEHPLPRALITVSDAVAEGMIKRFREADIHVPGQVAVIGFGDFVQRNYYDSELTSIRHPARQKGETAARMLQDIIHDPGLMEQPENVVITPELTIRKSCGCGNAFDKTMMHSVR